jgi:hypothetical protein
LGAGSVVRFALFAAAGITASASSFPIEISGSSSRFGVAIWRGIGGNGGFFGFERAKDSAGDDTDEYGTLLLTGGGSSAQVKQYTLPKNGSGLGAPGTETTWITAMTTLASSSFNNKKAVSPIVPFIGKFGYPMTIAAGIKAADWVTSGETFTSTVYGSTQTFMVFPGVFAFVSAPSPNAMAMRWD